MCLLEPSEDCPTASGPRTGGSYVLVDGTWYLYYRSGLPLSKGCLKREIITLPELIDLLNKQVEKYTSRMYSVAILWDNESDEYYALCNEFPGLTIHASTREQAASEIDSVIDGFIDMYNQNHQQLPKPHTITDDHVQWVEDKFRSR